MKVLILTILLLGSFTGFAQTTGPENGALVIIGGGRTTPEIVAKFLELAGGKDVPFVVIPTAEPGEDWSAEYVARHFLTRLGARDVTVLHTRDRATADSAEFVAPLLRARAVWFDGGRQWRLADSYLHTRTEKELHAVLARGGVIGGSSAGATIQGSYMVRGAPEGNLIMMAKGHEEGLGFLKASAIDQHVNTRKREDDLAPVVDAHPEVLGIGLDESTAIIVQRQRCEVMGAGRAIFHDQRRAPDADGRRWFALKSGEVLDLTTRQKIEPSR